MRQIILALSILFAISASAQSKEDIEAVSHYQYLIWPTKTTGEGDLRYTFTEVAKILRGVGLEMYSDADVSMLSYEQKKKALGIHISASQSNAESVLTVDFSDYYTDIPVASVRGKFGMGWNRDGDMKGAIKRLKKKIYKLFRVQQD